MWTIQYVDVDSRITISTQVTTLKMGICGRFKIVYKKVRILIKISFNCLEFTPNKYPMYFLESCSMSAINSRSMNVI